MINGNDLNSVLLEGIIKSTSFNGFTVESLHDGLSGVHFCKPLEGHVKLAEKVASLKTGHRVRIVGQLTNHYLEIIDEAVSVVLVIHIEVYPSKATPDEPLPCDGADHCPCSLDTTCEECSS